MRRFFAGAAFRLPGAFVSFNLLLPFFVFLIFVREARMPQTADWLEAAGRTFLQAGLTTVFSVAGGLCGARGLAAFQNDSGQNGSGQNGFGQNGSGKRRALLRTAAFAPLFLPPLLFCLSLVSLTEIFAPFPFGMAALIAVHTLTSVGLTSCVFADVLQKESGELCEWGLLHNISPWRLLYILSRTVLRRDIKIISVFVFVNAWTSLSVPMLIAGSPSFSLEFFIYEKLQNPALWPEALSLLLIQIPLVSAVCLFGFAGGKKALSAGEAPPSSKAVSKNPSAGAVSGSSLLPLLPSKPLVAIPLLPSALYAAGLAFNFRFSEMQQLFRLGLKFLSGAFWSSFLTGMGTGAVVFLFLCLMSLSFQSGFFRKAALSYLNPGAALTAFAFLILSLPFGARFDWALGISWMLFPFIYRFRGESLLEKTEKQAETARLFGAGPWLIFQDIILPLCRKGFFLCAGLGGFWACGEFAYSLSVSRGEWNLALAVYDLFSSYKTGAALQAAWLLLLTSGLVFLLWAEGAERLCRRLSRRDINPANSPL